MKRDWVIAELQEYWTLQASELRLLENKSEVNRLGLALLLKFFQIEGRFPENKSEIPKKCAAFIADQLEIEVEAFHAYILAILRSCAPWRLILTSADSHSERPCLRWINCGLRNVSYRSRRRAASNAAGQSK